MRDPIELDGVIKYRSSRETTMVGRGASLDGRLFLGGTDGSNPVPSGAESTNFRFLSRRRRPRLCGNSNDWVRFYLQFQYSQVDKLNVAGTAQIGQHFETLAGRMQVAF